MGKVTLELSEKEMRHLAEMAAMILPMLAQVMPVMKDPRIEEWQRLCAELLKEAHYTPGVKGDLEYAPDCGYWYFKHSYVEQAFFSEVLEEYRDSVFWEELVTRMAQQCLDEALGVENVARLSEEERNRRVSSLEQALWQEVTRRGIARLAFLLPEEES